MTDFSIVHEFDCDVERYWRVFFDEAFNEALYRALGMKERTVLERGEEGGGETIRLVLRIAPDAEVPAFVRGIVGDRIAYIERSTFRRSKSMLDVEIALDVPRMRDTLAMRGVYSVTPAGEGRVRREYRSTVTVNVPLMGRKIEQHVADQIRRNYETTAAFTRRWLAEHE